MTFENRYSFIDRLLHRLAFATPKMQIDFAELEDASFIRQFGEIQPTRPVFITALPRAGTTLLLNLCSGLGEFAIHTYRDMPFLLTPYLWRRVSKRFHKRDLPRERAHGDGVMVDADSPEAFEEMLWKAFWPDQYKSDRILTWPRDDHEVFRLFFRRHMAKLGKVCQTNPEHVPRYASKNNLNIARIGWIKQSFPDATIIVPFREPGAHAASLLRQHLRFLDLHRSDGFMREYMAGVGHLDFGETFRPIDFDGWLARQPSGPDKLGFWLAYWMAAYRHCLANSAEEVVFFDYDELCRRPEPSLDLLGRVLGCSSSALTDETRAIRFPRVHPNQIVAQDTALLEEARDMYENLRQVAGSTAAAFR